MKEIQNLLKEIADIERILARISSGKSSPRDIINLGTSLDKIPFIKSIISKKELSLFNLLNCFIDTQGISSKILKTIKMQMKYYLN